MSAARWADAVAAAQAEAMMRRAGIRWLSTTTKSIEEIATTVLQAIKSDKTILG